MSNDDIIERIRENFYGNTSEWRKIERKLLFAFDLCGSRFRYLEDESPASAASYAAETCRRCLDEQAIDPADVNAVIFGAVCREYFEPAMAFEVAAKAGISRPQIAFDITNACSGLLTAITAFAGLLMLDQSIGIGVVTSAEGTGDRSKGLGWISYDIQSSASLATLAAGLTVGNAAGSLVLSRTPLPWGARLVGALSDTFPEHHNLSVVRVDGVFECDTFGLFRQWRVYPEHILRLLERIGWSLDDVGYFCVHQPSERIVTKFTSAYDIDPEKVPLVHGEYGNTASVSPFVPLYQLLRAGKVCSGTKLIVSAASAGITLNSLALEWSPDLRGR